ncbi:hypothetical protein [Dokdonella sp.]|uniref:hypothetical protein n=1 Tax=Dokdonella sp. TaxID=2291710 RepID=UPI002612E2DE|nr:hypothetical protein [Dokdonella sp.]
MPKDGLDDRWFGLDGTIGKAARTLAWHDFRADRGGRACGPQSDALLTCPLRPDPGWLPKYASYRRRLPDRRIQAREPHRGSL